MNKSESIKKLGYSINQVSRGDKKIPPTVRW